MFKKISITLISTTILSFSLAPIDIQKLYKNGLQLLHKKKYKESNSQLLQALSIKEHPQIVFWISYNYANLKQKDSCQFYSNQILKIPPQPMEKFYLENLPKIEYWLQNSDENGIIFIPTLSKKQKDSLANRPENWGLTPELMKDQMKRIYNNSLKSIKLNEIDSLQLQ